MLMTTASYQADRLGSDDVPAQPTATCGVPTNTSAYNVPKLSLSKLTVNETGETASPIERQQKGIVTRDRDVGEIGASFDAELLTSAFSIPRFQTLDDIEDRCASMLGIKRDRLRIYSLTPLTADSALLSSHGTQRIAIEVEKSCKSIYVCRDIGGCA